MSTDMDALVRRLRSRQMQQQQRYPGDRTTRIVTIDDPLCQHAADTIDALRAQVEALRADAERYRWLRGGPDVPPESNRWARWEVRHWCGRWWNTMFSEALDAAIDEARARGGK